MKAMILTFSLLLGAPATFAGPQQRVKTDDFNQMIQENQKSEAQLRMDLQKEAGIRLNQDTPGKIAKENREIPSETEQVVVSSSDNFWKEKKSGTSKSLDKAADMKRLSQELDEASPR
jgi:hypothetical protein